MGRQHSPKGQIVLKKTAKLKEVDAALPNGSSPQEYVEKFRQMYPEDWAKIVNRYKAHERKTPRGKGHPMPEPNKYLLNMVKHFIKAKSTQTGPKPL